VPRKVKTVSFRTVKALWYGEISRPRTLGCQGHRREAELIEARKEAASSGSQFQNIAGGMRATDQDFYSGN
jgi:hypothetical protein